MFWSFLFNIYIKSKIIHQVLNDPKDNCQLSLIYANKTEDDILVREELEEFAAKFPKQFHLHYTLDNPPAVNWKGSKGFITKEMIVDHLPPPASDTVT